MLTWLIGCKSTGALSAGHISSNQQDDASGLRLLLIQSWSGTTASASHNISVRISLIEVVYNFVWFGCYNLVSFSWSVS